MHRADSVLRQTKEKNAHLGLPSKATVTDICPATDPQNGKDGPFVVNYWDVQVFFGAAPVSGIEPRVH